MPTTRHHGRSTGDAATDRLVDVLVREIAEQCAPLTELRLPTAASKMAAAELRGYVRARAMQPVRLSVGQLVAQERLPSSLAAKIHARAVERIVHAVARDVTQRSFAITARDLSQRAAA